LEDLVWWFLAFSLAVASSIVLFAVHYRVSRLERARAAQQAFSRQLIESQENERKRIAAELHDSLGQRLIIIKNLALLFLQSRVGTPELAAAQRKRVEEISAEVSEALQEVKEISYNLRPYRLDRLGLTATLQVMIEMASAASSIRISAEIDNVDAVFAKPAEINFYRIVQECVNNVLKHSQAAHASVCIRHSNERVMVTVQDDGRGFAPDSGNSDSPLGGFGLTGVSERAQLLGGKATIHSAPERGTTVVIEIALER
jgi:signal transduction histidine kinase